MLVVCRGCRRSWVDPAAVVAFKEFYRKLNGAGAEAARRPLPLLRRVDIAALPALKIIMDTDRDVTTCEGGVCRLERRADGGPAGQKGRSEADLDVARLGADPGRPACDGSYQAPVNSPLTLLTPEDSGSAGSVAAPFRAWVPAIAAKATAGC